MVFSSYKKLRIVFFHRKNLKAPAIRKRLLEEGMVASRQGIHDFDVLANDENVLANGDNVLENGVCEQLSKNLLIRCKLEASAYTTVRIAYSLLKRPCDCNGITKNVKFILTTTVHTFSLMISSPPTILCRGQLLQLCLMALYTAP